ncbi:MAG: aminotransferase [Phycisphaerae bacterium SG8_4]|nr:MAG: aminotransferase [Phycisphaerae bacterium SG8_4]
MIKFLDLKAVNERHAEDFRAAFNRVLDSGWYLLGEELANFESEFASYCRTKHAVGVGSGFDALILTIRAYGFGRGDEIIVPSNTYIASVLAITACGAEPVFVEPDPRTYLIDATGIEQKLTERTKAVMPVHLYGQSCEMTAICKLAARHRLKVIDDAAQAHGSVREKEPAGSGSENRAIAFSFYPAKNLGAMADAGAVATNDGELAEKIRALRNYGSGERYFNKYAGVNSRMDEFQAAVLSIKLRSLDKDNASRRKIAQCYLETINNDRIILPKPPANPQDHVWHLFVITTKERDRLKQYLLDNEIQSHIHYPVPPHKQQCYRDYNSLSLPIAERLANEVLSLPMSPVMSEEDVQRVARIVSDWK